MAEFFTAINKKESSEGEISNDIMTKFDKSHTQIDAVRQRHINELKSFYGNY